MDINQLERLIKELRDDRRMTRAEIRDEVMRRIEAENDWDCDDEVECGYDRPIAGVPLPPVDIMIDCCLD